MNFLYLKKEVTETYILMRFSARVNNKMLSQAEINKKEKRQTLIFFLFSFLFLIFLEKVHVRYKRLLN